MNKRQAKKRKQKVLAYALHNLVEIAEGRGTEVVIPGWMKFYDGSSKRRSVIDWDEALEKVEKQLKRAEERQLSRME